MIIDNHNNMSSLELLNAIKGLGKRPDILNRYLKNHHPTLYNEVVNRTIFLDSGYYIGRNVPILARVYCLEHNIIEHPKCSNPRCDNYVEWRNGTHEFARYCCFSCYKQDPNSHSKEETTKMLKYGDAHYNNREKGVETSKAIWGVGNFNNRDKFKLTCNARFGGNAPACSSDVIHKIQETKEERYGDAGFNNHEKTIDTVRERYFVDNVSQIPGIQEKVKETSIKKYGVSHFNKSVEFKKIYPSIRKRQSKKWWLFWNELGEHKVIRKGLETEDDFELWENYLRFDSKLEVDVFVFCKIKHKMDVDYQPETSFSYFCDGVEHTYHPDFSINGRLYEVKGDHFFKLNENGVEVMFNPYRKKNWSDSEYDLVCRIHESKHQCMIENNVIILRNKEIENLSIDLFKW